ncbi:hypothetical protein KEJ34_01020 [Candidatus Bathyarchaeota archaeon]|nr:hypothetical protein [Candidatus Bathyarchaeota archaeon]
MTVNVEAKPRRMVAVDETKIKANGEWRYVWAAIEWIHDELVSAIIGERVKENSHSHT